MTVLFKESVVISKEQAEWMELRGWAYQLLTDFLTRPPRMSLIAQWCRRIEQKNTIPSSNGGKILRIYLESIPVEDFRRVCREEAEEYNRLFMGSDAVLHASESAYLINSITKGSAINSDSIGEFMCISGIRSMYLEAGVVFNKLSGERDDHIAMELEFMAVLTEEMNGKAAFRDRCLEITDLQIRFMESHLLKWAHRFSEDLAVATNSPLYKGLSELLSEFLTYDYQQLIAWRACQ
ncbi:chaperone protein TorD [compost metagenome]